MLAQAGGRPFQHGFKGGRRNRDGAGKAHVAGRRSNRALGHIGNDGRDNGIAQLLRNLPRQQPGAHIVLAQRDIRPALLDAADGHQHGRSAVVDTAAQLRTRQFFQHDAAAGGRSRHDGRREQQTRKRQDEQGNEGLA
ncbi:hypothetical protein D3C81_1137710 [compost metagenome]